MQVFTVAQEIRHGEEHSDVTGEGLTLEAAVANAMERGPIGYRPSDVPSSAARVTAELQHSTETTLGWAWYIRR
ncbi:hypothetical protein [Streptomyces nanshensis]|uniref:Uncharacterized protein n=1 Tax=Streptomyces nanshensis TaxID=518642 RepID=A0A1E7LAW2_9ACTN|nr:hypothetical protein [Streptomyces nanshensis]OEV13288.1 hypothetical protein AN218_04195 [Streptomyces nanshensis]